MTPPSCQSRRPISHEQLAYAHQLWSLRRCFVCDALGHCPHRELDVALAEFAAVAQRRSAQTRKDFIMDTHTAPQYLRANFDPSDRVAIVAINRSNADEKPKQRIDTIDRFTQDDYQRWLRYLNAQHFEIYVSMNTIRNDSFGRTKADIAQIRHVYLDFDNSGPDAARQLIHQAGMPAPNHLIESSPGKSQAIWRVHGFESSQAETLMRGLVKELGADPAAIDISRVLRIPGFYNHKYDQPHFITVQNLSAEVYTPAQFPTFQLAETLAQAPATAERAATHQRRTPAAGLSQSERDWAYAKRALARGENPESIIQSMAAFRTDKPNPEYYARHTVTKAAAGIDPQKPEPKQEISPGLSLGLR